jgi:hypothetical protein
LRQGVEERRFADIRQTHDAAFKAHGLSRSGVQPALGQLGQFEKRRHCKMAVSAGYKAAQ